MTDVDPTSKSEEESLKMEKVETVHSDTLKETEQFVNRLLWCIFLRGLSIYTVESIWVLYAREFTNDASVISIVLYCNYLLFGFSSFILASLSELIGYDFTLTLCYIGGVFGTVLQLIAPYFDSNEGSFVALSIGYLILQSMPGKSIVLAFMAWILPLNSSKQYTATLYQLKTTLFVLTPIIAGAISYYWSYQGVFVVTLVASVLLLVYVLFYVNQQQKHFESLQKTSLLHYYREYCEAGQNVIPAARVSGGNKSKKLDGGGIYDENWVNSPDYRFPILDAILKRDNKKRYGANDELALAGGARSDGTAAPPRDNDLIDGGKEEGEDEVKDSENRSGVVEHFTTKWDYLSKYEWYLLFIILFQNCMGMGIQVCVVYYYAAYMEDLYNSTVIVSTSQIAIFCFGIVSGTQIIKYYASNNTNLDSFFAPIVIISYVVAILYNVLLYPNLPLWINSDMTNIIVCYFASLGYGLTIGILMMITELRLLELQPKEISGRIVGIRGFFRGLTEGTMMLLIGQFWEYGNDYAWFWYIQAASCGIGIICVIAMSILTKKSQKIQYSRV